MAPQVTKVIEELIEQYGSEQKLASAMGTTQPTLNRLKRKIPSSVYHFQKLAKLAGVPIEDLLGTEQSRFTASEFAQSIGLLFHLDEMLTNQKRQIDSDHALVKEILERLGANKKRA